MRDARDPCPESGITAPRANVADGADECVLAYFLAVTSVIEQVKYDALNEWLVALDELRHRCLIPACYARSQFRIGLHIHY
jgi:hypothetical protein